MKINWLRVLGSILIKNLNRLLRLIKQGIQFIKHTSSNSKACIQDSLRAGPLLSPALSPAIAPNTSAMQAKVRAATPGEVALDATGEWKQENL